MIVIDILSDTHIKGKEKFLGGFFSNERGLLLDGSILLFLQETQEVGLS